MNVAFIPVRGGSKSIPLKNIKHICGKPLVYWVIRAACLCKTIDKVYVSTDSTEISRVVESFDFDKVQVVGRSKETATDCASTESAMIEFAHSFSFDNIALIQATSPMLTSIDLEKGFNTLEELEVDSVLSVVKQKRFNWKYDDNGYVTPLNYNFEKRPRRQDFDGYLVENGAFYICSREALLNTGNRLSGRIKAVEMSEESFLEIDEPSDWTIVELLMKEKRLNEPLEIPEIKLLLTDCDGCLTDAGMYYSERGDELKKFNTRDGMGFKLLKENGILTGIITSENVELNKRRADKLKLDFLEMGCIDKAASVEKICKEKGIDLKNVAYVGDDINDIEIMRLVGLGCAPADAAQEVRDIARIVTRAKGGEGVIREVTEIILHNVSTTNRT